MLDLRNFNFFPSLNNLGLHPEFLSQSRFDSLGFLVPRPLPLLSSYATLLQHLSLLQQRLFPSCHPTPRCPSLDGVIRYHTLLNHPSEYKDTDSPRRHQSCDTSNASPRRRRAYTYERPSPERTGCPGAPFPRHFPPHLPLH
ncbi:hypothetical protein VTJ04DRAFT_9062 [Mycothermus thermophilus]|uniref:uncharacterized protein n=1 Tax=Humicola insolens TaxID=85995 RepID=UPI0037449BC4